MVEDRIRLQGWSKECSVVLVRKLIKDSLALQQNRNKQMQLAFADVQVVNAETM